MNTSYSVSQINAYIKNMFQTDFLLNRISVTGEVSNCKYHSSGHIYFTLKDAGATLACVMFAGDRKGLKINLFDGVKIKASGSISVYERDGKYQLYAKEITKEGVGELYEKYLALKEELEQMGMFDAMYKKPIPKYASKIGVVTADTGAAIQDIINISHRRNPYVQLILYPAKVQGEGAAQTICEGIEALDKLNLDVLIVGRGGGSIEDLWAFNEECVARAVFNCETPVISAVGHEVDFTIIDYVADLRAPTPSAAAELAVFDVSQIINTIDDYRGRLFSAMLSNIDNARNKKDSLSMRISYLSPERRLADNRVYCDRLKDRLDRGFENIFVTKKHQFDMLRGRLSANSPLDKLGGGYGFVTNALEHPVKKIDDVECDESVHIRLKDGVFDAVVTQKTHL